MDELTKAEKKYFDTKGTVAPRAGNAAPDEAEPLETAGEAEDAEEVEGAGEDAAQAGPQSEPEESQDGAEQSAKRRVPLAELLSERERRKNAESELARSRGRLAAIESQLAVLAADEGALPDGGKDPEGYAKAVAARAERHKSALANLRMAAEAHARQAAAETRVMSLYRGQVEDFAAQQPDFQEAYRHLIRDREQELAALGFADPVLRDRMIKDEETAIVARALQDGASAAERIYAVSKRRGYKAGAHAGERLRMAERGQAAGRSLGGTPGAAARPVSPEALANLSEAEFAAATAGKKWRGLWG